MGTPLLVCLLESKYYLPGLLKSTANHLYGKNSYFVSTGVKVLFTWAIIVNNVYGNNSYVVSTGVKVLFTCVIINNHLYGSISYAVFTRV